MEGNEWKISGIAEANKLSKENKNTLKILLEEFKKKLTKNKLRLRYYRNEVPVKNLGIAVPSSFEELDPKVD